MGKIYDLDKMTDAEIEASFAEAIGPAVKGAIALKADEDQTRYVKRSTRTWREPSAAERLQIIQEQIRINDQSQTDFMYLERDMILRRRECVILAEIALEKA